jgi:hypothetical protein
VFVSRFEQIRIEQIVFEQKCIDENRGQPYMKLSMKIEQKEYINSRFRVLFDGNFPKLNFLLEAVLVLKADFRPFRKIKKIFLV